MGKITKLNGLIAILFLLGLPLTSIAADVAAGKTKSMSCAACHGSEGISFSPDIPNLAGQKAGYLVKAIKDYKTGARKNPMMQSMVGGLSDDDMANLAAYYASLK